MIVSVVLDVGETPIDDTREFGRWASWLGVPRHTFSALLGAVTVAGRNNADAFQFFRPRFNLDLERRRREECGVGELIEENDLYPDARPGLAALRERGVWVGLAGNQTARAADLLRALDLPVDAIATSAEWGVAKPDSLFFDRMAGFAPGTRAEIVYVGDHRDMDIIPAHQAGLRTALIRHGPWGYLWADDPGLVTIVDWIIESLADLVGLFRP